MELADSHWGILEACTDNRQTRANLAAILDLSPDYVSTKLSQLQDYHLIERPGPAENSGMWSSTPAGELAVAKQEKYERRHSEVFGEIINDARTLAVDLSQATDRDVHPEDLAVTSVEAYDALHDIEDLSGFSVREAKESVAYDNLYAVHGVLYELWFWNLLSRTDTSDGQAYDITGRARGLLDQVKPAPVTVENINRQWIGVPSVRTE